MPDKIMIREVKPEDFQAIYLLNKHGLGYDYAIEKTKARLQYVIEQQSDKILVAACGHDVVGYIHGSDYECTYADSLKNILTLVVDEDQRGQGIGRLLMQGIENWAKETGAAGVRLVSGFNREGAHRFYLSCGFMDRKNQKNFIKFF